MLNDREKFCNTCRYYACSAADFPCCDCHAENNLWEKLVKEDTKGCFNCHHADEPIGAPVCVTCYMYSNYKKGVADDY